MLYIKGLILLCFMDALLTDMGIRGKMIEEWNPIARFLYESSPFLFYGYKILLPILLMILYSRVKEQLWVSRGVRITLILYLGVLIYHGVWISMIWFSSSGCNLLLL